MEQKQVVRLVLLLVGIFVLLYLTYESWWYLREHAYDGEIRAAAARNGVNPLLVKAVVWRESRFNRFCIGSAGEIGLMQIMSGASREWAASQQRSPFSAPELFNAANNLDVGSWYLARALRRWKDCDDPVPFALAEYNAGHANALKWQARCSSPQSAREFVAHIGIASTRRYVQDVTAIEKRLERRGHL